MLTCDCLLFSYNIFLNEILRHQTLKTWWKYNNAFISTISRFSYSSSIWWHWLSSTPLEHYSSTFWLAQSLLELLVRHSMATTLGLVDNRLHYIAQYWILCHPVVIPSNWHYPCNDGSEANCQCLKCFHVHCPAHIVLAEGHISSIYSGLIQEFSLQANHFQHKVLSKIIILRVEM